MKFDKPATDNPIDRLQVVGQPHDRIDGARKVTGTARYAYEQHDVAANQVYGYVLGAGIAKGRIASIELDAARNAPGVLAVVTAREAGNLKKGPRNTARLLAADAVHVPAQPSPFDGWASAEMLAMIAEARIFRPLLVARFVLNRCPARTIIARDTAQNLADHDPPALHARIGQRVIFADAARNGQLVFEYNATGAAAREIAALAAETERLAP